MGFTVTGRTGGSSTQVVFGGQQSPCPCPANLTGPKNALSKPPTSGLFDDFGDNNTDPLKFVVSQFYPSASTAGTASETGGQVQVTPEAAGPASTNRFTGYKSVLLWSLVGSTEAVRVTPSAALPAGQQAHLSFGPSNATHYQILLDGANLTTYKWIGNVPTNLSTTVYNSVNHAWWRIRHGGAGDDTMYFETAPASASNPPISGDWSVLFSVARDRQVPIDSGFQAFGTGNYTTVAAPVMVAFDGFNTGTSSGTVYNDNLTESAAAADSASPAGSAFGVPLGETAAAGDSESGGLLQSGSLTEAAAAGDAEASAQIMPNAVAASAAASDAEASAQVAGATVAESALAADSETASLVAGGTLGEAAAAHDAEASSLTAGAALAESAAAADVPSSQQVTGAAIGESSAAGDGVSAGASTYDESLSESVAAVDQAAASAALGAGLGESALAAAGVGEALIPGAVDHLKVWTGSGFVAKPVKVWTGSNWTEKPLKRWDGAAWAAVT